MKKFSDMQIDEVINVINDSETLRDMLDRYIQETESDWLGDLLRCFDPQAVDYSIGFFDSNYFTVKDSDLFLDGVRKSQLYANLIWSLIECRIKASTQGGTASPISPAKIRIFL